VVDGDAFAKLSIEDATWLESCHVKFLKGWVHYVRRFYENLCIHDLNLFVWVMDVLPFSLLTS